MPRATTADVSGQEPARLRRVCSRCSPGLFRRVNRSTWAERTVLTWLGFFPWECVICRRKRFFRDAGRKSSEPAAA